MSKMFKLRHKHIKNLEDEKVLHVHSQQEDIYAGGDFASQQRAGEVNEAYLSSSRSSSSLSEPIQIPKDNKNSEIENSRRLSDELLENGSKIVAGNRHGHRHEVKVTVLIEIISASEFRAKSPIFIHYTIHLPPGWSLQQDAKSENFIFQNSQSGEKDVDSQSKRIEFEKRQLEGYTHSSYINSKNMAHFSHPFSLHLKYSGEEDVEEDDEEENNDWNSWNRPMVFLVVKTIEGERVRVEGYGHEFIPMSTGHFSSNVHTWTVAHRNTEEMLNDMFLNVTPCLNSPQDSYLPPAQINEKLRRINKLGLKTRGSGVIKLRFQTIWEGGLREGIAENESDKIELLEKMRSATIRASVQKVIEAFQRAKLRAAACT